MHLKNKNDAKSYDIIWTFWDTAEVLSQKKGLSLCFVGFSQYLNVCIIFHFYERPPSVPVDAKWKKSRKDFCFYEMINFSLLYAISAYKRFLQERSDLDSEGNLHLVFYAFGSLKKPVCLRTNLLTKMWKAIRCELYNVSWRPLSSKTLRQPSESCFPQSWKLQDQDMGELVSAWCFPGELVSDLIASLFLGINKEDRTTYAYLCSPFLLYSTL